MTLNGLEGPLRTLFQNRCVFYGAHHENLNEDRVIDPYCQRRRCSQMTLDSGNIRFMRIFAGVPWRGDVKRQWGCRKRQFSVISLAIPSLTLEMRLALLYSDTQSIVGFSMIPKCMTLSGYFTFYSAFAPLCLAFHRATFENNCVKTNEDRHILSAAEIFGRDSSFW